MIIVTIYNMNKAQTNYCWHFLLFTICFRGDIIVYCVTTILFEGGCNHTFVVEDTHSQDKWFGPWVNQKAMLCFVPQTSVALGVLAALLKD